MSLREFIEPASKFKPGDIVRWSDKWGVCAGFKFAGVPLWDWFDFDGSFIGQTSSVASDISAPYDWDYGHIPEPVLVRATAWRLAA